MLPQVILVQVDKLSLQDLVVVFLVQVVGAITVQPQVILEVDQTIIFHFGHQINYHLIV